MKTQHDEILRKIAHGATPCFLGKCAPHICGHLIEIYIAGMKSLDTNCNELLANINSIRANLEKLQKEYP